MRLVLALVVAVLAACGDLSSGHPSQFVGVWVADLAATEAAASRSPVSDPSAAFAGKLAVVTGALADGEGVEIHLKEDGRVEISGPAGELPPGSWSGSGDELVLDPDGTGKMRERYRLVDGKLVGAGGICLTRR